MTMVAMTMETITDLAVSIMMMTTNPGYRN
jgi:hypothetical protein